MKKSQEEAINLQSHKNQQHQRTHIAVDIRLLTRHTLLKAVEPHEL